jgi:hypothetical protein
MPETAIWHDPGSLLRIEYSPQAMEAVRQRVLAGPAAEGLLLGEREGARVHILESAELEQTSPLQVVGWYLTKNEDSLTPADLARYRQLFPAQWQIVLALRIRADGIVAAAFYVAGPAGEPVKGREYNLEPWIPQPEPDSSAWRLPFRRPAPSKLSWLLIALAALAVGAAAFEFQTSRVMKTATQPAPAAEVP